MDEYKRICLLQSRARPTDVLPGLLHQAVAVDVGQLAEAEPLTAAGIWKTSAYSGSPPFQCPHGATIYFRNAYY